MKKVFLILFKSLVGILSLIGLLAILMRFTPDYVVTVKFINDSGQEIKSAKIEHNGKFCKVEELLPNGNLYCDLGRAYEGSYLINILLENNKTMNNNNFGYIAGGTNNHHIITLEKTGELNLEFVK